MINFSEKEMERIRSPAAVMEPTGDNFDTLSGTISFPMRINFIKPSISDASFSSRKDL